MKVFRLNTQNSQISSCSFSSDGNSIVGGKSTGEIFFFKKNGEKNYFKNFKLHNSNVKKILSDRNLLFTASSDSTGSIWDKEKEKRIRIFRGHSGSMDDIDFEKNQVITAGQDGILRIWDKRISHELEQIYHGFNLTSARFIKGENLFVSCGMSPQIFVWDLRNLKEKRFNSYYLKSHKNHVTSLAFSKKKIFFSIDASNHINKWLFKDPWVFCKRKFLEENFRNFHGYTEIKASKISCDSKGCFFSLGGSNGESYILFQKTGKLYRKFSDHIGNVKEICFHPEKKFSCSCGDDGSLVIRKF